MKTWIALFSQTGSEIYNVSKRLGRFPDRIIVNKDDLESVNEKLLESCYDRLWIVPSKPSTEEYQTILTEDAIVTMHGWLRIMPHFICDQYNIYNLHPAPLTRYPHLKGKDPQKRVFTQSLPYSGNTLHKCTAELDSGEIILENEVDVQGDDLDLIISKTHSAAADLWVEFLSKCFYNVN